MISVIYEHQRRAAAVALVCLTVCVSGCASTGPVRPVPFPGSTSPGDSSRTPVVPDHVVQQALALRGTPYRLGGDEPRTGLDCSGLVRYVFWTAGIVLPRTVGEQFAIGIRVSRSEHRSGDLVFFDTTEPGPSHVGIIVDGNTFVHAPGTGGVVRVERLDTRYWRDRLRGIKRVSVVR